MKPRKALVVEDSASQADLLEFLLHNSGIKDVTKSPNGVHALECFAGALKGPAPYSLVFLDIIMPEMDGQEALKQIRGLERNAGIAGDNKSTIIMTTSLESPKDMIQALIEGDCTDYIVKPVDEDSLKVMLARYGFI